MRSRLKTVLLVVALAALWMFPTVLQTRDVSRLAQTTELVPHRSTLRPTPSGMKALYLLLQRAGYRPERWRRPLSQLGDRSGMLVLAPPNLTSGEPRSDTECEAIREWLQRGNAVLLLLGDPVPDATPQCLGIEENEATGRQAETTVARPTEPAAVLSEVERLAVKTLVRLDLPSSSLTMISLASDEEGTVLAVARVGGKGMLYVCSDAGIFSNERLDKADAAVLAVNLAAVAPEGRVLFDELHQGYGERPSLIGYLWQRPRRFATLQLLVALALFLFSAGQRFGRVSPDPAKVRRRDPGEYVRSMGSLYQSAGARHEALRLIHQEVLRALSLALGLPGAADRERLLDALACLRPGLVAEARRILDRAEQALAAGPPDEQALQTTAAELVRLRRKIIA